MKSFLEISKERYTTKHYDPTRKISDDDLNTLKEILRLTPSAVNIQPWFFYFGTTEAAKLKIMPAIPDFNIPRIQGCSCFVVLCSKTRMTDDDLTLGSQTDLYCDGCSVIWCCKHEYRLNSD